MKPLPFSRAIVLLLLAMVCSSLTMEARTEVTSDTVSVERYDSLKLKTSLYERRIERYHKFWTALIPNQIKVQYAGSIGMVSGAAGWHYGPKHREWETDLFFGYVPKDYTRTARLSVTLKQSYIPFRLRLTDESDFEPLSCGVFLNTISGEEFWGREPSKYPKSYYGFSTKFRFNIFIGERLRFSIPTTNRQRSNSVSVYYELSTNELYIVSYATNRYIKLWDILSLCFGLKFDLF